MAEGKEVVLVLLMGAMWGQEKAWVWVLEKG
jgi:hypothetical protein